MISTPSTKRPWKSPKTRNSMSFARSTSQKEPPGVSQFLWTKFYYSNRYKIHIFLKITKFFIFFNRNLWPNQLAICPKTSNRFLSKPLKVYLFDFNKKNINFSHFRHFELYRWEKIQQKGGQTCPKAHNDWHERA